MDISMGPFITCTLGITFLTVYLYIILYKLDHPYIYGAKVIFAGIAVIFLRMCIPVNFPFTYTIPSRKLLLPLASIVYVDIGKSGYMLSHILMLFWLVIAAVRLAKLYTRSAHLSSYLNVYTVREEDQYKSLFAAVKKHSAKPMNIAVVPQNISPAISGILHPTIIFPKSYERFTAEEMDYICMHEINHYKNHDLWMKRLLEVLSCIHWWNPLVYLMKREYALTLELASDYLLMQEHSNYNSIDYAELILKIARSEITAPLNNSEGLTSFVRKKHYDLEMRLSFILKDSFKETKKGKTLSIHTILICVVMILSLFIVVDPDFKVSSIDEDGSFTMEINDTYFIHTTDGYEIYVEDIHVATIPELPDEFKNYNIYEEGEQIE